ncbi:MAG TPA: BMP family ABC transporter substrate-binding protein [Ktedonobacteraceae bacterium]|nr:BMP family ABC transporter substrate-binding protein [Ktedonobacteraceae bacterium]
MVRMRKLGALSSLVSLLTLFSLVLAACGGGTGSGGNPPTSTAKTVALVTDIGGLNDQGFNQLANTGYEQARAKYGFPRAVIETKSQSDYVSNLTRAAQSSDLVIGVGFLMATALDSVAKANPTKKFALIDSCATDAQGNCDTLPNVAPLLFKEEQAGCLVGAVAAQMEADGKAKVPKLLGHNTIAAIGGIKIPPVDHYIAGYKFCAQKVNPNVQVIYNYSQSFDDTAKCKDVALSQINQHQADIIFQVAGGCGIGALQAADEKGVYGIGVDKDQSAVNKSVITSALKRVDQAVSSTINSFEAGKYTNNPPAFDLNSNGVGYATPTSDVPADAKAAADNLIAQIKSGALSIPNTVP